MQAKVLKSSSPEKEIQQIHELFQAFLKKFSTPDFADIDPEYKEIERLAALCKHDFEKTLTFFDPGFSLTRKNVKPSFTPTVGEQVLSDMLDLHFIIANLSLSPGVEKNLTYLLEKLQQSQADSLKSELKGVLTRMERLLSRRLPANILFTCIEAIKEDPFFNPPTDTEVKPFLDDYLRKMKTQYEKGRERLLREQREDSITQEVEALFGGADLLEIEGYTEHVAERVAAEGFSTFSAIKPLRILKSFTVAKFDKKIKDVMNKLLLDGYFENKPFQNNLTSVFYHCDEIAKSMQSFEEELMSEGQLSFHTIHNYLDDYAKGKPVGVSINRLMETIDKKALKIIEDGSNHLYNLANYLLEIINDFKQSKPTFISNIKVISGTKNREFMTDLVNGYNDLVRFSKIIKNFTVLKSKS